MWVHEQTQLLECRELAANGRGRDLQSGSLDKRARPYGLATRDVALDDSSQDCPLPLGELGFDASGHFAGILGEKLCRHAAAEETAALGERERVACLAALDQAQPLEPVHRTRVDRLCEAREGQRLVETQAE